MFESATLKLTGWYLLILMSISVLFSVAIYSLTIHELSGRIDAVDTRIQDIPFLPPNSFDIDSIRSHQLDLAKTNIFFELFYINLVVLALGGAGSYLLARRTLAPIERSHEAQSRFTSDASHELRTPLAVMKAELEVALRDNTLTNAEMREILGSNLEEVEKLVNLSGALLELSKLDDADLDYHQRVNLYDAIMASAKRFDKTKKRVKIPKPKLPLIVMGNQTTLSELFGLLIDNALKYSPADSTVKVTLRSTGRTAMVTVSNSGPGISKDDLPHIFDRFYRADKARTSHKKHGYGLGLALAKKIVELHGGDIHMASTPNKTTTVSVSLPHIQKNI